MKNVSCNLFRARRTVCLLSAVTALALFSGADWMRFRGTGGSGKSAATGIVTKWDAKTNIAWKTEMPGGGASSPITVGDKIFLTCFSTDQSGDEKDEDGNSKSQKQHLVCVSADTGAILWNHAMKAKSPEVRFDRFIKLHGAASSTPVSDGQSVFAFYGASGVHAFDLEGKKLWSADVGTKHHVFGTANSPILFEDLVIVNASVESGRIVALDKKTGNQTWEATGVRQSWNTPVLAKVADHHELIVNTSGKIMAFDPKTGKELWTCKAINGYMCPSVIVEDGVVYTVGGRAHQTVAVRAGGQGDVTETHRLWKINIGSNVSSPVLHDGHLYWSHETQGTLYCVEAKTGKIVYQKRLEPRPGRIYASPTLIEGRLYYVSRKGGAFIVAAKPEFELLEHNSLGDESVFNGSPVVIGKRLLIRSDKYLYCLGK